MKGIGEVKNECLPIVIACFTLLFDYALKEQIRPVVPKLWALQQLL